MARFTINNEVPWDILSDFFTPTADGLMLTLKIKPQAAKEKLFLAGADGLCLSVRSPAVENAANSRVVELIAILFCLPKSSVIITSGHKSRTKRILLKGQRLEDLASLGAAEP